MQKNNAKAYFQLVSAMLIFGTIGIFRRNILLSSGMLAFVRGVIGGLFLCLFRRFLTKKHPETAKTEEKINRKNLFLLILTGAFIGINWILLFESYSYTTVSVATMCYYMQPTFVLLLSPIVLRERLTVRKLLCAAAAIFGMVLISGITEGSAGGAHDFTGILLGLGAAVFYAAVILLNKKITVQNAYRKTEIQLFSASAAMLPYLLLTEDFSAIRPTALSVALVLFVCIFHTGFAYALYFGSMTRLRAQSVAVLSYIDPVFALFLSALVLHEPLSLSGIIGAVLIIGSAVVSEISPAKN